ncbi:MAG: hypothetical protein AAF821_03090 [Cyanobacteria bacterium P01_D01_bin.156]
MTLSSKPTAPSDDDYVIVGLAKCFRKQDGNVVPFNVLEPVPSAYFEALLKGVPTSYSTLYGVKLGEVIQDTQLSKPLSMRASEDTVFCEHFIERANAAARTYQNKELLQRSLPHGQSYEGINFSTDRKRILNATHTITAEDNVKQHKYTHMTL